MHAKQITVAGYDSLKACLLLLIKAPGASLRQLTRRSHKNLGGWQVCVVVVVNLHNHFQIMTMILFSWRRIFSTYCTTFNDSSACLVNGTSNFQFKYVSKNIIFYQMCRGFPQIELKRVSFCHEDNWNQFLRRTRTWPTIWSNAFADMVSLNRLSSACVAFMLPSLEVQPRNE